MSRRTKAYQDGVRWIALNDEPTRHEREAIAYQLTTLLLADVHNVTPETVADDVIASRIALDIGYGFEHERQAEQARERAAKPMRVPRGGVVIDRHGTRRH